MKTLFSVGSTVKRILHNCRALRCDDDGYLYSTNIPDVPTKTHVIDHLEPPINVYIHENETSPTLSGTQSVGSRTVTMSPTTDVDIGDALTLVEFGHVFQSIVSAKTVNDITIVSPLDRAFTTACTVRIGSWNLNKNGSVTPIELSFPYIPGRILHIKHIGINMIDGDPMDSSTFGSVASLANGLIIQHHTGTNMRNLALIVNNSGFSEQGFKTAWDDKPPAGVYGVRHLLNAVDYFGVALDINDNASSKISAIIQDNLSDMTTIAMTLGGHMLTP